MPKVFATDPTSSIYLAGVGFLQAKAGTTVNEEIALQLEAEIKGDPGCADKSEPCDDCRKACEEFSASSPDAQHNNPKDHTSHHICADVAHLGHVGVPGRKDIRVERDAPARAPRPAPVVPPPPAKEQQ